jgi:hypothetical protein
MLDSLAHRYKLLPSEVIQRGDTLDVLVMETTLQWQRRHREAAEAKATGKAPPGPKLSQEQLKAMMARSRSDRNEN